jgi:hypothetical protein
LPGTGEDVAAGPILVVERGAPPGLLALANLTAAEQPLAAVDLKGRRAVLSTEQQCYGGRRDALGSIDRLYPHELVLFDREDGLR